MHVRWTAWPSRKDPLEKLVVGLQKMNILGYTVDTVRDIGPLRLSNVPRDALYDASEKATLKRHDADMRGGPLGRRARGLCRLEWCRREKATA